MAAARQAVLAVLAVGGTVTGVDTDLALLTVTSSRSDFAAVADGSAAVLGWPGTA